MKRGYAHGRRSARGFTLTELAVVVFILALLIGGTIATLSAQNAAREISDSQRTLEQAREALLGFGIRYSRLPCPATDGTINNVSGAATTNSGGAESFCTNAAGACGPNVFVAPLPTHGRCSNPDGFLPAATLGVGPTDPQGFLLDAWQGRVRYAVTQRDMTAAGTPPMPYWIALDKPFTSPDGLKRIVIVPAKSPPYAPVEDLQIVTGGTTIIVPAVIYSTGKNRVQPGLWSADETENDNRNGLFVFRTAAPDFDDQVVWLSSNVLFNRLIAAGAL